MSLPERYIKSLEDDSGDMTMAEYFEEYGLSEVVNAFYQTKNKGTP